MNKDEVLAKTQTDLKNLGVSQEYHETILLMVQYAFGQGEIEGIQKVKKLLGGGSE